MRELIKKLLWIGLTVMVIKGFFQFEFYYSEPVFGWVIDAETGERLEGVTVEAQWKEQRGSSIEKSNATFLQKLTTVTDKEGSYHFPKWGPKIEFGFGVILDNYSNRPTLYFTKERYGKKIFHCYSSHYSGFLFFATKMKIGCYDIKECCGKDKIKLYKLPSMLSSINNSYE